jgi:hypothetical protein
MGVRISAQTKALGCLMARKILFGGKFAFRMAIGKGMALGGDGS